MSMKRTASESSNDERTNNDPDRTFQEDDDAKRIKLASLIDTTFRDLPVELVECILVRAVAMEVEEMHLAKSAWKEKADLVISRLSSVCPDWSNILTTNFFQNELYRTLDRTVKKTIRLEIVNQSPHQNFACEAMTIKEEMFMIGRGQDGDDDYAINVYDRSNLNLAEVTDSIPLIEIEPRGMAACNVSNCLYILNIKKHDDVFVLRIAKEQDQKFSISPFIQRRWKPDGLSVTGNGSLILWKRNKSDHTTKIVVYDANGSLQHKMKLSSALYMYLFYRIIAKPNGNLVLVSTKDENDNRTKLTEIDMNGNIQRQYQSSVCAFDAVCLAGQHGRIAIVGHLIRFELLDNEFNVLNVILPQQENLADFSSFFNVSYNCERNEFLTTLGDIELDPVLFVFHLTEE